jgi:hypothetical protein
MTGNKVGKIDGSVGIRDAGAACAKLNGTRLNQSITQDLTHYVQLQSLVATNDNRGGGHHPTEKDIVEKDSIKVVQ